MKETIFIRLGCNYTGSHMGWKFSFFKNIPTPLRDVGILYMFAQLYAVEDQEHDIYFGTVVNIKDASYVQFRHLKK